MSRPRKLTPIEEYTIYEMKKKGVPATEIAYKNGISTRTVDRIVKRIKKGEKRGKATIRNNYLYNFEDRLNQLLEKDGTHKKDLERKALFYIIARNDDLYKKVDYIYDFKNRKIKSECLKNSEVDFCSSSRKLIRLAFNLYNGYNADILDTFSILDEVNFNLAINALRIRFNRG